MGRATKVQSEEPVETKVPEVETPAEPAHAEHPKPSRSNKPLIIGAIVAAVIIAAAVGVIATKGGKGKEAKNSGTSQQKTGVNSVEQAGGDPQSSDPVAKGKYLSLSGCTGTGSKKLGAASMKTADISVIEPYGLVAGGHVTPVDHQYYYGKDQSAAPSTYDVFAPADGTIVNVEARQKGSGKQDFRIVISYSCTFFSYVDLVNSLSAEVAAKMPSGYETINGPQAVKIPVKQGQAIAKIGGQSLDFAVWDTTKTLSGLLVPKAYNNAEPWKLHTVLPTDYYTDALKAELLPYYVRSSAPRDGKLDYDVDGTASGNWFKSGTNGYIGAFTESDYNSQVYADGHLSLAPNFIDPTGWIFSTGAVNHGTQYAIKSPSVTPDKLNSTSGAVKYELAGVSYRDQNDKPWIGTTVPTSIKLSSTTASAGTALVQLTAKRELKVQIFLGKTPAEVSGFTADAVTYTRGDEATTMSR